jgi:PleD family two-component response regulator
MVRFVTKWRKVEEKMKEPSFFFCGTESSESFVILWPMKKRILLLDESVTVQKVVALTLDRERFAITNAKTRSEAMKSILENPPDLILVSDQVAGVSASAFPKEVETWEFCYTLANEKADSPAR